MAVRAEAGGPGRRNRNGSYAKGNAMCDVFEPISAVVARLVDGLASADHGPRRLGAVPMLDRPAPVRTPSQCVIAHAARHSAIAGEENGLAPTDAGDTGCINEGQRSPMPTLQRLLDHRVIAGTGAGA